MKTETTLADLIRAQNLRQGAAHGSDRHGAFWRLPGAGDSPFSVTLGAHHWLDLRHYGDDAVRGYVIACAQPRQASRCHPRWEIAMAGCTTVAQVRARLFSETGPLGGWPAAAAQLAALGLAEGPAQP